MTASVLDDMAARLRQLHFRDRGNTRLTHLLQLVTALRLGRGPGLQSFEEMVIKVANDFLAGEEVTR